MHVAARLAVLALALFISPQTSAVGAEAALPRLTGIVVGPRKRIALFVDRKDPRTVVSVEEGGEIAGLRILAIKRDEVVLKGPSGVARLQLEQDANALTWRAPPPELPSLRAQTSREGEALGVLALQRDRCARAGLLPGVAADAEEKLLRLIAAISHLPAREGADAAHDAPTQLLASALSAGLDAAKWRVSTAEPNAATCESEDAKWRAEAGRMGAR